MGLMKPSAIIAELKSLEQTLRDDFEYEVENTEFQLVLKLELSEARTLVDILQDYEYKNYLAVKK